MADATKPAAKAGEKLVTIYDRGAERRLLQSEDDSRGLCSAKFSLMNAKTSLSLA
ncbi:hypothetical protein KOY48_04365 [Candidatus Minimicrobia naudis]|uniref:Uncharacterized protein n=1 Tax=Candidatus Minimicrobia naudis TaxID=2841263 RepID=A0A8F1SB26_9BACT|nr:hypothetical protein KOY48_04365 [Candidatus Minimicrobia naudis]